MTSFLHAVLSDNDQPSLGRLGSGLIVVVVLGLMVFLTLKDGKLPDLAGLTLFTTGSVGVLYGTSKAANVIEGMKKEDK